MASNDLSSFCSFSHRAFACPLKLRGHLFVLEGDLPIRQRTDLLFERRSILLRLCQDRLNVLGQLGGRRPARLVAIRLLDQH